MAHPPRAICRLIIYDYRDRDLSLVLASELCAAHNFRVDGEGREKTNEIMINSMFEIWISIVSKAPCA